ncbi:MAG TPA: response regulator [Dissulfurispiraceae bacterium]|nr:response regulator [Dissulfurispiraceae bacterium]
MKRVLVIDDEKDIVELVAYNLRKEGFDVDSAHDGEQGLKMIDSQKYDLIFLDLMLPGIQGIELCKMVRSNPDTSRVPIVMLTAKGEEIDKILGLEVGADDYITKPFSPRELVARARAILRRSEQSADAASDIYESENILKIRDLTIDKERFTVLMGMRQIKLSATEFKLLLFLAERPKKIFNREQLLDMVWGSDVYVEPRTVDVHIRRLRAKIEEDPNDPAYIKTMRGVGYYVEK